MVSVGNIKERNGKVCGRHAKENKLTILFFYFSYML
jgi:hypothetical protein